MKKLITIFMMVLMFQATSTKAQITLQHTIDTAWFDRFYMTDIDNNDYKYVFFDVNANNFSLFNMDMSPYLTNIAIPSNTDSLINGFIVIYLTKTLFDCDSTNLEYVYEHPLDGFKSFRVFRTDGTLLFQKDSTNGPYSFGGWGGSIITQPIRNTSDGTKLWLQQWDPIAQIPKMFIYSLCGSLPVNYSFEFTEQDKQFVKISPNPTSQQLNFEITFPNNQEEFQIVIFDNDSKELKRENISLLQDKYSIDVKNLSSGTYIYSLVSKKKMYQTGKFVLTK